MIINEHVKKVEKDGKHYFDAIRGSGKARLAGSGRYSIVDAIKAGNYKAIMARDQSALAAWSYPTPEKEKGLTMLQVAAMLVANKVAA